MSKTSPAQLLIIIRVGGLDSGLGRRPNKFHRAIQNPLGENDLVGELLAVCLLPSTTHNNNNNNNLHNRNFLLVAIKLNHLQPEPTSKALIFGPHGKEIIPLYLSFNCTTSGE